MRSVNMIRCGAMLCGLVLASAGFQARAEEGHDDHPSEGPHHGTLIELGQEDFHAELVHDDETDTITIYVLDAAAKKAVPIVAKKLTLNLLAAGKPKQFHLAAKPQEGDPKDSSSAFAVTDKGLCEILDTEGSKGRLNVEIGGKVYAGEVSGHGHEDEDHHE